MCSKKINMLRKSGQGMEKNKREGYKKFRYRYVQGCTDYMNLPLFSQNQKFYFHCLNHIQLVVIG